MKRYVLTSPKFEGQITFGYGLDGHILLYHNECDKPAAIIWMKQNIPVNESDLPALRLRMEGSIQEVPQNLSFDAFWDIQAQGKKVNKLRCTPLFKKLSEAEKMLCIMRYKPYVSFCTKNNRGIVDPENYLRKRYFETDWQKEK